MRLHPKKDKRAHSPDKMAQGMFIADAVASLEYEFVKTLGNTIIPTVQVKTLEFKNIMNEITSMFQ
jgi:hypothetical protein